MVKVWFKAPPSNFQFVNFIAINTTPEMMLTMIVWQGGKKKKTTLDTSFKK